MKFPTARYRISLPYSFKIRTQVPHEEVPSFRTDCIQRGSVVPFRIDLLRSDTTKSSNLPERFDLRSFIWNEDKLASANRAQAFMLINNREESPDSLLVCFDESRIRDGVYTRFSDGRVAVANNN